MGTETDTTALLADPLVSRLVKERDDKLGMAAAIKQAAVDQGRDLNADDLNTIKAVKERVAGIDAQLDVVADNLEMDESVTSRLARIPGAGVQSQPHYRSDGELLYDLLHQSEDASAARYRAAKKRAAQHMGNLAADTTATAGDLAGIAIQPIVGPVINPDWSSAPLISALGPRRIPAYTFERPYLTDAGIDSGVAAQSAQKAELASVMFEIDSDILKGTTYGGYLNIAQQLISLQPGSLQEILRQMRRRMSRRLETAAVTEFELSAGAEDLPAGSDAATTVAAFFNASAAVFTATGDLGTHCVCGPLGWARLGGLADDAGRPMFPTLAPSNAPGSADASTFEMRGPAGLKMVVSPAITHSDFWVTNTQAMEVYQYAFPLLESVEPSVLGRQVAVATSQVAYRPTPLEDASIKIYDVTPV